VSRTLRSIVCLGLLFGLAAPAAGWGGAMARPVALDLTDVEQPSTPPVESPARWFVPAPDARCEGDSASNPLLDILRGDLPAAAGAPATTAAEACAFELEPQWALEDSRLV